MNIHFNRNSVCIILFLVVFFAAAQRVFTQDYGLIINQKAAFSDGEESSGHNEYALTPIPWFAAPLGEQADLYLSGGVSIAYDGDEWKPVPELYRSEIIYNPIPRLRLEIGRLPFSDCLYYTMDGLFDGASARINIGGGRLGAGLFYTGLLYKKTAYVFMSPEDYANYHDKDTYFASRRLAAGINWEHTSIFNSRNSFYMSGIFQFDLNDEDFSIHSQYLETRLDIPLSSSINTEFGFAFELAEETGRDKYGAFIASAETQWLLPTASTDILSLAGFYSSGSWNDNVGAFIPLTSQALGKVLRPTLSGIALIQTAYTIRLYPSISADLFSAYFFRTDTKTWYDPDIDLSSDSPLVGGEIFGGLTWSPFSEVLISAGAGIFLPKTGGVFKDDADLKYRVELTASVSF